MHKDRFKQMYRVSRGLLTCHRRLLDLDHGQALASRPPVKEGCCQRSAIRLHARQLRRFRPAGTYITTVVSIIYERQSASGGRKHVS